MNELNHHIIKISQKFALLFLSIIFFDELLDMFSWIIGHIFEIIEYSFDLSVEHLFHTNDSQTEQISFYIILTLIIFGLSRFYKALPHLIEVSGNKLFTYWLDYKHNTTDYWQHLSWSEKFKLASTYALEISLILVWITL